MTRKPPELAPPEVAKREKPKSQTEVRRYKLITPLFGGGVKAGVADPITLVRGTAIRGILRFWWRATRGGLCNGSVSALKHAEEEIWGGPASKNRGGPSDVDVKVQVTRKGQPFKSVDREGNSVKDIGQIRSVDSYAAFPLRDQDNAQVIQDIEFDLTITFPRKMENDVMAALWAWETFGGIGARTRRGFGALRLTHVDDVPVGLDPANQVETHIRDRLKQYVDKGKWPAAVPHLSRDLRFRVPGNNGASDAITMWRRLVKSLHDFRQHRKGKFGRSKWPEADAIRRATNDWKQGHEPQAELDKFPRGQFGLPIIFQFKQEDVRKGDPDQTTLQGKGHERLASPLILRPIACAGSAGKKDAAVGLAAILEAPVKPPGGWVLKEVGNAPVKAKLSKSEAETIDRLKGNPDVLGAFLDYLA